MILPTQLTINKQMIWILRSPVLPLVYVTTSETRKVRNHTGAVSNRVAILEYPSVLTMVGKKYWNVCVRRETCWKKDEDIEAVVFKGEQEAFFDGDGGRGVGFFGVVDEAPLCEVALFFGEPF
jgi:hypothetical protein